MQPGITHARIRRAVRSLEERGYIEVKRNLMISDRATGRQRGHVQNAIRLTVLGYAWLHDHVDAATLAQTGRKTS